MGSKVAMHLGMGEDNAVHLDGINITDALHGVTLARSAADFGPTLTLDLLLPTVEADGDVTVLLSDATRALLLRMGWTPPAP